MFTDWLLKENCLKEESVGFLSFQLEITSLVNWISPWRVPTGLSLSRYRTLAPCGAKRGNWSCWEVRMEKAGRSICTTAKPRTSTSSSMGWMKVILRVFFFHSNLSEMHTMTSNTVQVWFCCGSNFRHLVLIFFFFFRTGQSWRAGEKEDLPHHH